MVDTATGVSLDYIATDEAITIEHYAFLVTETEFDDGRIKARGLDYWADPRLAHKGEINRITAAAAAISSTRRGAIWRSWRGLMGPVDSRRRC